MLQGLSLTSLSRLLNLGEDNTLELGEAHAREEAARAGLTRLNDLSSASWPHREHIDRMRAIYTQRVRRASPIKLGDGDASAQAQAALRRLRHEALAAERRTVISLRDQGVISDEILHRLEQELDIEAMRLGLGEVRGG